MTDHPGGLRPPPLLKRGGESNVPLSSLLKRGGESNIALVIFPLNRGGESNITVVIFPSSYEEGCPRSGRGGKWRK